MWPCCGCAQTHSAWPGEVVSAASWAPPGVLCSRQQTKCNSSVAARHLAVTATCCNQDCQLSDQANDSGRAALNKPCASQGKVVDSAPAPAGDSWATTTGRYSPPLVWVLGKCACPCLAETFLPASKMHSPPQRASTLFHYVHLSRLPKPPVLQATTITLSTLATAALCTFSAGPVAGYVLPRQCQTLHQQQRRAAQAKRTEPRVAF